MLANGSTAIEGRSGSGRAGLSSSSTAGALTDRLRIAQSGDERLGGGIGLGVQLALEKRDQVVVVPERLGPASRSGQRLHDHAMGVFAHVVERDGALGRLESGIGTVRRQFLRAEPHQGAERQVFQPLALAREPLGPAFFADGNVVHEPAAIEIGCSRQGLARVLANQLLEPADIASDCGIAEHHDLAIALQRVLPDNLAQPEQRLPQVLLGLGIEMRSPQQGRKLFALLRPGRRAGEIGQQAGQLLVGQIDRPVRPCKLDAPEQRKAEFCGGRQRLIPMRQDAGPEKPSWHCILHFSRRDRQD